LYARVTKVRGGTCILPESNPSQVGYATRCDVFGKSGIQSPLASGEDPSGFMLARAGGRSDK